MERKQFGTGRVSSRNEVKMKDLEAAKKDFFAGIPHDSAFFEVPFRPILDELIAWSEQYSNVLTFTWHEGKPGVERQSLVKYCLTGTASPFWAVWPRPKDGAKLTLLTDKDAFPGDLRNLARERLAAIGGHKPKPVPEISMQSMIPQKTRAEVIELMTGLMKQVTER